MTSPAPQFPFGQPVLPRTPPETASRRVFILGAAPNAFHIEWKPPAPFDRVAALAVDNEPQPFWTGADEAAQLEAWAKRVMWNPEWGSIGPAGELNSSSGQWLDEKVLGPLGFNRGETWFTDCLDTYRFTRGQEQVVVSKFEPFAKKFSVPWAGVAEALKHASEDEIFNEVKEHQLSRLKRELRAAQPKHVITLGNAALRVFAKLVGIEEPALLDPKAYGETMEVKFEARPMTWRPLMHPGQRSKAWQNAHSKWLWLRPR